MVQATATIREEAAPTEAARPRRFHARLLRDGSRLYWWAEAALILAFYVVYSAIRNANEGGEVEALRNARQLIGWERSLGLYFEQAWQSWALDLRPLVVAANYFYGSLHFVVTGGAVVYLFRRHSDDYPLWRNTLAITTGLALLGFILWPLMPPRLLPEHYGFVDTLARYPTFWSFDSGAMQDVSNQFAAMPSLHFAWAAFCAAALVPRLRRAAWRWALALYPVATLAAVVVTGNHYWLDAAGGAAILVAGYLLARLVTRAGRRAAEAEADVVLPSTRPTVAATGPTVAPDARAGDGTHERGVAGDGTGDRGIAGDGAAAGRELNPRG